jgi:Nuclease-related domain
MLMLRTGGQFTDHQIRKHLKNALLCFAIAVVAILAMRYIQLPFVGLITTVLGIALFKANFTRWSNWSVGKRGEMAISDALGSLSDDYIVLNDLMLPDGKGNVDHLVMGPNGLFAIETKNYSTFVKCLGDDWFVNGKKIRSLSKQAKRNAMAVRENLAAVFADQGNRLPFVTALLVFVNGNGRFSIKNPTVPVLRSSELAQFIARHNSARPPSITSPELRRAIVHHLHLLQQKPDKLVANS